MNSHIMMLVTSWSIFAIAYIALLIYRKQVESHEDDTLHFTSDSSVLNAQQTIAHKLDTLDRWSKILMAVVIGYGVIVASLYLYSVWQSNSSFS